jgi:predicted glycoside hydrolase/deacetylase ChbG (UPF0249 family)
MVRWLALCADDYGASAAINRGVLSLLQARRLSEVSCMVGAPTWPAHAKALRACEPVLLGCVRLGLHFNLTEGEPMSTALARVWPRFPPLPTLMVWAHLGRLPLLAVAAELHAQWHAFADALGQAPAHLDGHQHVHHLPGIRVLVLQQLASHPSTRIRMTAPAVGTEAGLKRWLIEVSGGQTLARNPRALQQAANRVLLGVYDFRQANYRSLMQRWLAQVPARGGLLLCHPAQGIHASDPIGRARDREWQYLSSVAFADDLAAANVRLALGRLKASSPCGD